MAKKVRALIKLQLQAGKATPAPPVGPALGQHGVNIMAFVKEYNEKTASQTGTVVPVHITVYEDRSFTFAMRTPPASELLRQAASIEKGAPTPGGATVAEVTRSAIRRIAENKIQDLNASSVDQAMKMIEGTARSMGIGVTEG